MQKKSFLYIGIPALLFMAGCTSQTKPSDEGNHADSVATDTEVMAETVRTDKFRTINDTVFHRSKEMMHDEYNGDYYYYSEQNVSIEWPEQLAECEDIKSLQQALIHQAFGKKSQGADIDSIVHDFVNHAKFLEYETELTAIEIPENDSEGGMNNYYESVRIYPSMTSPSLLTFAILHSDYAGGAHGNYTLNHVNFDKKTGVVFDAGKAFEPSKNSILLKAINERLDKIEGIYDHAKEIPDFYADADGICFVFQPYAVACYPLGLVKVKIPYAELHEVLTAEFQSVITDARNFKLLESEGE